MDDLRPEDLRRACDPKFEMVRGSSGTGTAGKDLHRRKLIHRSASSDGEPEMNGKTNRGCITLVAILGAVLFAVTPDPGCKARAAAPEDKPQETVRLTVFHDYSTPTLVLVRLLSDGKAVRSRQLRAFTDTSVTWDKLPVGPYELQFEADGYETAVKKIVLAKEDKELKFRVSLTRKVGSGDAAFRALAERVKKLEEANAELRATVSRLQKEIDQLKKK
jgi:hypothetical protein